jgi:hypothetical protein
LTQLPVILLYAWGSTFSLGFELTGFAKWIVLFVLIDLIYYVYHWMSHRVSWMWAVHGVHHQSEDYNFSVGLRQAWLHKLTAFWTPIPLALIGFELSDYVLVLVIHSSLQIWTHTQLLPNRIPWLERVLVTPSHHRVHHGQNPQYIDKNFGALLSVWDYLFETYEPEAERVLFGVKGIPEPVNPLTANFILFSPGRWKTRPLHQERLHRRSDWRAPTMILLVCMGYFVIEKQLPVPAKASVVFGTLALIIYVGKKEEQGS